MSNVAIVDASMTDLVRPALYNAQHSVENLTGAGRPGVNYILAGTVCETSDLFCDNVLLLELCREDLVSIKSAGAYGSVMASRYNMHSLAPHTSTVIHSHYHQTETIGKWLCGRIEGWFVQCFGLSHESLAARRSFP